MVQSFRQGTQHAKLWPARYTKAGVPRPQGLSLRLFMPAVLLAQLRHPAAFCSGARCGPLLVHHWIQR